MFLWLLGREIGDEIYNCVDINIRVLMLCEVGFEKCLFRFIEYLYKI